MMSSAGTVVVAKLTAVRTPLSQCCLHARSLARKAARSLGTPAPGRYALAAVFHHPRRDAMIAGKVACLLWTPHRCPCVTTTSGRTPARAGYVNELEHGRFGEMSTGEKFGTAAGGLALGGILYEAR